MTRERKIYIIILTVALVGLSVDRLFLSDSTTSPEPAQAAFQHPVNSQVVQLPGSSSPIVNSSNVRPITKNTPYTKPIPNVWSRLGQIILERMNSKPARDIFSPSDHMKTIISPPPPSPTLTNQTQDVFPNAPAESIIVSSIMIGPFGNAAMINNQIVKEGQTIGLYRLIKVEKHQITLKSKDQTLTLDIDFNELITTQPAL